MPFLGRNIGDLALCVKRISTVERYGVFISRLNSGATKHVETGIPPLYEHGNRVFGDLVSGKKHLKNVMSNQGKWLKKLKKRDRLK
jgi:hypothetical protein